MRTKRTLTVLAIVGAAAYVAPAGAQSPDERPSAGEARAAVRTVLGSHADLLDGRLAIGSCQPVGRHSRVCHARIEGPAPESYRVTITVAGDDLVLRARHG